MFSDNPFFTIFNLKTIFIFFINWCMLLFAFILKKRKKKRIISKMILFFFNLRFCYIIKVFFFNKENDILL